MLIWQIIIFSAFKFVDLQPLADEYMPLMESIYCNVIYTGKMGTALIPKVCKNQINYCPQKSLLKRKVACTPKMYGFPENKKREKWCSPQGVVQHADLRP